MDKGIAEEQPLAKTTSSSEDGVDLGKSKATVVPVAVSVSDSIVQNDTQCALDGTSQISQQPSTFTKQDATSNCSSQSGQGTVALHLCIFNCILYLFKLGMMQIVS